MLLFDMVHYKKYRWKYYQQKTREKFKERDQLKKWNIISFSTGQWYKKAKILSSSLDELRIIFQKNWKYTWWEIVSIQKKDIQKLWEVRILNRQKK